MIDKQRKKQTELLQLLFFKFYGDTIEVQEEFCNWLEQPNDFLDDQTPQQALDLGYGEYIVQGLAESFFGIHEA